MNETTERTQNIMAILTGLLLVAVLLAVAVMIKECAEPAHAQPAYYGRGEVVEANYSFSTSDLTGAGVAAQKCAAFANQGMILELAATITAGSCTSVDLTVLDKQLAATTTAVSLNRIMFVDDHAGQEEYHPPVPVPFRSKSSGAVCIRALANGASCAVDVRLAGEVR